MTSEVLDHCGLCITHSLHDAYNIIKSLQHRGREAAGIAAIGKDSIDVLKWSGPVSAFDLGNLHSIFPPHKYHTYLAHVRYATHGRKDKVLEDAHPHVIGGVTEHRGDHIIIKDCEAVIVHNGQVNDEYFSELKGINFYSGCDTERLVHYYKRFGAKEILRNIPGSYTLAIGTKDEVIAIRDKLAMKPGSLGKKDGKYILASENSALTENGSEILEDVEPSTIYHFKEDGSITKEYVENDERKAHCFFEYNYLANANSTINTVSVRNIRSLLGEELAKEHKIEADFVTYLPRCPEIAAYAYSEESKIPFIDVFYKKKAERSFQGSTTEDRKSSIKQNLYIIPEVYDKIKGKRVIIIDDSIVRGNNGIYARELLEKAGALEVIILSYTPPIGIIGSDGVQRGCLFGVDIPPEDNFITIDRANMKNRSIDEISKELGMQTRYLSYEGMLKVFNNAGIKKNNLCTYCIGGCHPFRDNKNI